MKKAPGSIALLVIGLALLVFGPLNVFVATGTINYGIEQQSGLLLASGVLFLVGGAFGFFLGILGAALRKETDRGLPLMIFSGLTLVMILVSSALLLLAKSPPAQQSGALVMTGISAVLLVIYMVAANLNRLAN